MEQQFKHLLLNETITMQLKINCPLNNTKTIANGMALPYKSIG